MNCDKVSNIEFAKVIIKAFKCIYQNSKKFSIFVSKYLH